MTRGYGTISPHKNGWRVQIYIAGVRHERLFQRKDKPLATLTLEAFRRRKVEVESGLAHPAGTNESVTYGDVADEMFETLSRRKTYTAKTKREMRYELN